MALKSSIIALAGTIGRCQENSRSIKQALELGLVEMSKDASELEKPSEMEVVWTNSTPSSDYGESTVTITDGDKYDAFIVYFLPIASGSNALQSFMYPASWINDSTDHGAGFIEYDVTNGKVNRDYRMVRLTQAESSHDVVFNFGHGRTSIIATYGTAGTTANADSKMKPINIIGVKFW